MEERRLGYGVALGWALVASVVLSVAAEALVRLRPAAGSDLVTLGTLEAAVLVATSFVLLRVHAPDRNVRDALGLRPTHPGLVALALGLGVLLPLPVETLRRLVEQRWPTPEAILAEEALLFRADTTSAAVILVVMGACVAPLVEELFFRGALFGALRREQPLLGAVIASSVAFVLSHLDLRAWPGLVLLGLALGHVRAASGSLIPAIALHVGYGAVGALGLITRVSSVAGGLRLPLGAELAGWAGVGLIAYAVQALSRKSPEAEAARAEDGP